MPTDFGVYRPMKFEATIAECEVVEGEIPKDIYGGFYRNGPSARRPHLQSSEGLFTTDGMVQGLILEDGKASFRNRWVRTPKFLAEEKAGRALFRFTDGEFDDWRAQGLGEVIRDDYTTGVPYGNAATSTIPFAGTLLAIGEMGGSPVALDRATLETLGFPAWTAKLGRGHREPACYGDATGVAAHPKWDWNTGEMFGWSYRDSEPFLTVHFTMPDGSMRSRPLWDAPYAQVAHDAWLTENYFVMPFQPFTLQLERVAKEMAVWDWEPDLPIVIALIPRHDIDGEIQWITADIEPQYITHTLAANEADGTITLDGPIFPRPPLMTNDMFKPGDPFAGFWQIATSKLGRWTIDLSRKTVTSEQLDDTICELPKIDERFFGRLYKDGFLIGGRPSEGRAGAMKMNRLIHRDVRADTQREYVITDSRHEAVLEAAFIPRRPGAPEGDGYVIVPISKFKEGRAEYQLFDADDITAGPIARIDIPFYTGWTSHGCWLDFRDHVAV
jgi:carotenoid cleavage dioxygenase